MNRSHGDRRQRNEDLDAAWQGLCDNLSRASKVISDDPRSADPVMRAAGYRYLLNLLNAGLEQVVFSADPDSTGTPRIPTTSRSSGSTWTGPGPSPNRSP